MIGLFCVRIEVRMYTWKRGRLTPFLHVLELGKYKKGDAENIESSKGSKEATR